MCYGSCWGSCGNGNAGLYAARRDLRRNPRGGVLVSEASVATVFSLFLELSDVVEMLLVFVLAFRIVEFIPRLIRDGYRDE